MLRKMLYLIFPVFLFSACQNEMQENLLGSRVAVSITEEGKELPVNTEEITLNIQSDGTYSYRGTLNYAEAGTWFLEENLLYTQDTTGEGKQKAVLVMRAEQDTLVLGMTEAGKERILTLQKRK